MKKRILVVGAIIFLPFACPIYHLNAQENSFLINTHNISIGYTYKTDANWWRRIFDDLQFAYLKRTNDGVVKYEFGNEMNCKHYYLHY